MIVYLHNLYVNTAKSSPKSVALPLPRFDKKKSYAASSVVASQRIGVSDDVGSEDDGDVGGGGGGGCGGGGGGGGGLYLVEGHRRGLNMTRAGGCPPFQQSGPQ